MKFDDNFYLSGPMSGYEDYNFPAFQRAEVWLRDQGLNIISPREISLELVEGYSSFQDGEPSWTDFLEADLVPLIQKCKLGIILLQGWPDSDGAKFELEVNNRLKRPAYFLKELGPEKFQLISMSRSV